MASRKIIKKLLQSIVILLLIAIAFPATAFLLLQSKSNQTALANKLMKVVSEKLNTRFTVGSIDIAFLYRVRLNDVYLEDLSGDTLIYAKTLTAGIKYVNPLKRKISIGSINLDQGYIALAIDSASELNLTYFIDKLRGSGKKEGGGWTVEFNNLRLEKSRFALRNYYHTPVQSGMNFTDLMVYDLNADVKQFKPSKDSLSFYVKSMSLKEKSGFIIDQMQTRFSESKTFLSFRDLTLQTPSSDIRGDEISLRFNAFSQFKADSFLNYVKLRVNLSDAKINMGDVGFFAPVFYGLDQVAYVSGLVTGTVNNIRGKDMDIRFGSNSRINGNFKFEGLPDIKQTFIVADINDFASSAADVNALNLPGNMTLRLPAIIRKFGEVSYSGNFTGFINDFVAYGRFTSDLGIVRTDILFRPDSANKLSFEGKFIAHEFDMGTLFDASNTMGNISVTANVDGALIGKAINASLKGNVEKFDFKQYEYANISIAGDLKNKTFNGSVDMRDPNADLEFQGEVNFSDTIPEFHFTANITDANLYALNIIKSDPDFRASCYLIANAKGKSINNLNGEIKVLNSLFVKKGKQLQIYDLSLSSQSNPHHNELQFRSDFLDASIEGDYELTKSVSAIRQFLYMYLPSLLDTSKFKAEPLRNSFTIRSTIKNIKPVFDFFLPAFDIAENSALQLSYEPMTRVMDMHFQSDYLHAKSITWNGVNINAHGTDKDLVFDAGSKYLSLKDKLRFDNFTAVANSSADTSGIMIRWNNWDERQYKGTLNAQARITRDFKRNHSHIDIAIRPSVLVTADTVWHIQPGKIRIDTTSIRINNLAINHLSEFFLIDGALSENPAEVLNVIFNRFDLGNFNGMSATTGYYMGGVLNGKATLSSLYSKPLFTSVLKIDSLMVNNEMLGSTEINSSWDNDRKAILIEAFSLRNNLKTINIKGEYLPSNQGKLDFDLTLEKLRLNIFNPYVKSIFTDLRGIASGGAHLSGSASKPVLNGNISLQKTSFTVTYLQTRYNFSGDNISIENNNIYFKNIRIYDPKHNSAYLNGAIRNKYLKDFYLDLTIKSDNFLSLNTKLSDNKHFYGTAYATGVIKITGPPKNLFMDVTATTNSGTSVKIPLSNTGELNEYPFIAIKDPSIQYESDESPTYKADLSGLQIRFKLTITPDAEVQIIIDPVLGEIIKGNGSGSIDMRINTNGDFVMNGDFLIEKGDYLFTLQKVINKQLTIDPGGSIRWDGDPLNALVDITANYTISSASLRDLLGTEEDQKVRVEDRVIMTGRLLSPDIKYDIHLPDADESIRMRVDGAMPTNEEKTRQFISLLMTNRFYLSPELRAQNPTTGSTYTEAAGVNFSEMLSNQLSNWLSQIVNDLDVDLNYRANREMNSEEVQVALSYQFFNDRLTVNGSVDMATNATRNNADEIVGEFDIDYKLTKNGKIRVKTYNHANNEILKREYAPYTQGLGLSYKEDFNTFGELLRRLFGKKEESPQPVTSDETPGS